MWKEKPKVMYSVALVMKFLVAENENQIQEDSPQVDFWYALYLFISICCESQLFLSIKGYHVYMN